MRFGKRICDALYFVLSLAGVLAVFLAVCALAEEIPTTEQDRSEVEYHISDICEAVCGETTTDEPVSEDVYWDETNSKAVFEEEAVSSETTPPSDEAEPQAWVRPSQPYLVLGQTERAKIAFEASEGSSVSFTYSSDHPAIAHVDAQGNIYACAPGNTMIVAENEDGIRGELPVRVLPIPEHITVNDEGITICVGETVSLCFDVYPEDAYSTYSYKSSNSDVASVNFAGRVSGKKPGESIITIKSDMGNADARIPVTVISYSDANSVTIMAHRGASGYYPENTIEAFVHAEDYGADMVELDVRKTKDGIIICFHDSSIKIQGRNRSISDLTYAQILAEKPDVPELSQAMQAIRNTNMRVMVEIKELGLEQGVIQIVQQQNMMDRTVIGSFNKSSVEKIHTLNQVIPTVYIVETSNLLNSIIKAPMNYMHDVISVLHRLLTVNNVRDLHLAGKRVVAWTPNDKKSIDSLVLMGVDGIATNYPDKVF